MRTFEVAQRFCLLGSVFLVAACAAPPTDFPQSAGLADLSPISASDACASGVPPLKYHVKALTDDVPADLARFAGAWNGMWNGDLCTTLVVETVDGQGKASVIYGWGTNSLVSDAGAVFDSATITDGKLSISGATFWFEGENLRGSFRRGRKIVSYVELRRIVQ